MNMTKLCERYDFYKSFLLYKSKFKNMTKEKYFNCDFLSTKSKQGNEQTRTFEPTNESADCWPATHSYNFITRVK